jgi:hypothetical protein
MHKNCQNHTRDLFSSSQSHIHTCVRTPPQFVCAIIIHHDGVHGRKAFQHNSNIITQTEDAEETVGEKIDRRDDDIHTHTPKTYNLVVKIYMIIHIHTYIHTYIRTYMLSQLLTNDDDEDDDESSPPPPPNSVHISISI